MGRTAKNGSAHKENPMRNFYLESKGVNTLGLYFLTNYGEYHHKKIKNEKKFQKR